MHAIRPAKTLRDGKSCFLILICSNDHLSWLVTLICICGCNAIRESLEIHFWNSVAHNRFDPSMIKNQIYLEASKQIRWDTSDSDKIFKFQIYEGLVNATSSSRHQSKPQMMPRTRLLLVTSLRNSLDIFPLNSKYELVWFSLQIWSSRIIFCRKIWSAVRMGIISYITLFSRSPQFTMTIGARVQKRARN